MWLDCDTGHDDAFALLLAVHAPAVSLLGLSTVHGNASLDDTTYNTCAILQAIRCELSRIEVYPGASKPLCRDAVAAADIHGESGLDGTTWLPRPIVRAAVGITAVDAMYTAIMKERPQTVWLVATGALTNIALLFAVHPDLVNHIKGLSIMGGAIGGGFTDAPMGKIGGEGERFGNWTPFAEFNIYCDPEAAASIFSNADLAEKTTLIPLDLTHQFLATASIRNMLLHGHRRKDTTNSVEINKPSRVRRLFQEILVYFAQTYKDVFGLVEGPPLHDPLAVAAAFAPNVFDDLDGERFSVSVVTDGQHVSQGHPESQTNQCGRTVITKLDHGEPGVRIPRAVAADVVWHFLDMSLDRVPNG
ncbi:Inosine/uridine-preferring nucleoside hydrolase domain-containing protein [Cryomyces antarcticus]